MAILNNIFGKKMADYDNRRLTVFRGRSKIKEYIKLV